MTPTSMCLLAMDLVPVYEEEGGEKEPTSTLRIDPINIQNMGVCQKNMHRKQLVPDICTCGNITYDETRIYTVNTNLSGWIEKLYVNVGAVIAIFTILRKTVEARS